MAFTTKSILRVNAGKTDFNGDGYTDLIWQGADGTLAIWNMGRNGEHIGSDFTWQPLGGGYQLRGLGDFNGDGTTDIVWQNQAGTIQAWYVHSNGVAGVIPLGGFGLGAQIEAVGDFNADGKDDLLVHLANGTWFTASGEPRKIPPLGLGMLNPVDPDFHLVGVADFNGDGRSDILFRGEGGAANGAFLLEQASTTPPREGQPPTVFADPGHDWAVLGLADFNGDGRADILWQHENAAGQVDMRAMWLMNGGNMLASGYLLMPGGDWSVVGADDYNNDGKADLFWHNAQTGQNAEWFMDGARMAGSVWMPTVGDFWTLGGVGIS